MNCFVFSFYAVQVVSDFMYDQKLQVNMHA